MCTLCAHRFRSFPGSRRHCPGRPVGRGALHNTICDFYSTLNVDARLLESHTVEVTCALEYEVFGDGFAWYSQAPITGVERIIDDKRYVHSATMDLMLFDRTRIRFLECKPRETIEKKLSKEHPDDWVLEADVWTNRPMRGWALSNGFHFEVWCPPTPTALYLSNLQLLYALKSTNLSTSEQHAAAKLKQRLSDEPLTISEAVALARGLTPRSISILLAAGDIFGTVRSRGLDSPDDFILYFSKTRAVESDQKLLDELGRSLQQPVVTDPILRATEVDYNAGLARRDRALRMIRGDEPLTIRYKPLVKKVTACLVAGENPLRECLTNYFTSGVRGSRLNEGQEKALKDTVEDTWDKGAVSFKKDLVPFLKENCKALGVIAPSTTSLLGYIRKRRNDQHVLSTIGRKAYHAQKDPTDPYFSTIPAIAPGLCAHIDSTKFDTRLSTQIIEALPFAAPVLYVAMDSCGPKPIGRAIMFGQSCRDFLAVLMRDILWRQGWLPRSFFADGGSENTSKWCQDFCAGTGISRFKPPTGNPAKNSPAENALGRVNTLLAHRLLGSTAPDKQGRKTDNRFKSYNRACILFKDIVKEIDAVLFNDMAGTPTANNLGSPKEKTDDLVGSFGHLGIRRQYDDDFRILTSIPIEQDISAYGKIGYRHLERTYRSTALSEKLREHGTASKKLRDCVDPTLMYFKFGSDWVSGSSREAVVIRHRSFFDRLFLSMSGRSIRSKNAEIRVDIASERNDRIGRANASAAATAHLPVAQKDPVPENAPESEELGFDETDLSPFDEEAA